MAAAHGSHSDVTFRNYMPDQVQEYAKSRCGYPKRLIDEIIKQYASTGGTFGTLLDLGCGPGNATREVGVHFDHAFGMDPSAEMIRLANGLAGEAKRDPIRFLQGDAEECPGIADNSVDLITAATSAHWFDMERFWPTAARILKPGGSVAIFTIWRIHFHPRLTPHVDELQGVLVDLEQGVLGPYQLPGNWSLMSLYSDLQNPWSLSSPCTAFSKASYRRQVWNLDGQPEEDGAYICGERETTLEDAENSIATISAVTRWRAAHPSLAATDKDCVKVAFKEIQDILQASPSDKVTMVGPSVLLTFKKDAGEV